jgi:anti-anti-sigma factor
MAETATLSLETTARDAQILTLDGQFDVSKAQELEIMVADGLDAGTSFIVLDLRGLSSIDAGMLRALVDVLRIAERRAGLGSLCLVRPNPVIWKVFVLTGLSTLFPAFSDLSEALLASPPRS